MNGMTDFEQLLYKELQGIRKELRDLRVEFAQHKVRSSFFGTLGGLVAIGFFKLANFLGFLR